VKLFPLSLVGTCLVACLLACLFPCPVAGQESVASLLDENVAPGVPIASEETIVPTAEAIPEAEARRNLANSLAASRGNENQALTLYEQMLAEKRDRKTLLEFASLLARSRSFARAAAIYEEIGVSSLARGETLAYLDALQKTDQNGKVFELTALRLKHSGPDTDSLYLYVNSARKTGQVAEALAFLSDLSRSHPKHAKLGSILLDLAFETGDEKRMDELLVRAVEANPNNPSVWRRKAERSMSAQDFAAALHGYERVVSLSPEDPDARRQLFRLYAILGDDDRANAAIEPLFVNRVDNRLLARLQSSGAARDCAPLQEWISKHAPAPEPYALTQALDLALRDGSLGSRLPPPARAAVLLALEDVRDDWQAQQGAWIECMAVASAREGRQLDTAKLYRRLSETEPENVSALYGLAGTLTGSGDLEEAREIYGRLVTIHPSDATARGALRKATDLLRDTITVIARFQTEDATGRLANISRAELGTLYGVRINDRLTLEIGPRFWIETPQGGPSFFAEGFTIDALIRYNEMLSFRAGFGMKIYNDLIPSPLFTGNISATVNAWDRATFFVGYDRRNIIHNVYDLEQGIQADVLTLTASSRLTRRLDATVQNELLFYSDSNIQNVTSGTVAYTLLRKPGTLRAAISGVSIFTNRQSEDIFEGSEVVDVRYPYWTPNSYLQGVASLSWNQDLSPRAFAGQKELSYRAKILASADTTSNILVGGELGIRWEIVRNLIFEAAASIQRSQSWNGSEVTVSTDYRF